MMGEGRRAVVEGENRRAAVHCQGIGDRWERRAGLRCYPGEGARSERLSAMCWESTDEGAAVNHGVRLLGRENVWACLGIARRQVGWGGLHSRCDAWLGGEGVGGEPAQRFERSVKRRI
jgi:hypothetical protein